MSYASMPARSRILLWASSVPMGRLCLNRSSSVKVDKQLMQNRYTVEHILMVSYLMIDSDRVTMPSCESRPGIKASPFLAETSRL